MEFSAGGVVVRGEAGGRDRADQAGLRWRQRVLGAAEGPPRAGETAEQAAAREVREEAGVSGELVESLGEVAYTYERKGRKIDKTRRVLPVRLPRRRPR